MLNYWPWIDVVNPSVYRDAEWPKISIVTPSFNQGEFIEETILSVINQNYPNLEYIIIDGGSTDQTVDIIKKYQDKLKYWVSEPDNGQTAAINKGMQLTTGTIIGYLNSDDCLLKEALHIVAQTYSNIRLKNDSPMMLSGHSLLGPTIDRINAEFLSQQSNWNLADVAAGYGVCPQPSTFWTKSEMLFDEELTFCMDFDYWVKLTYANFQFVKIDKNLSFYRIHDSAKGNLITDVMWLELVSLSFKHTKYIKDFADRAKVINSSKYKLRNYYLAALKKESYVANKKQLLSYIVSIFFNNIQICLNFRFIKFAVGLIVKKKPIERR